MEEEILLQSLRNVSNPEKSGQLSGSHSNTDNNSDTNMRLPCNNLSKILENYDYESLLGELTRRPGEQIVVPVIFVFIFLVGVVGNALVIYVVCQNGATKNVTNLYLVNLAAADILFLVACMPFTGTIYSLMSWPFGEHMCKFVNYIMLATVSSTMITTTALSIDRYYSMMKPMSCNFRRSRANILLVLTAIWVASFLLALPTIFVSQVKTYWDLGRPRTFCLEHFPTRVQRQLYVGSIFLLLYMLPLSIIATSYYRIANNLWRGLSPQFLRQFAATASRQRRRLSRTILAIVLLIAGCWLPIHIVHLVADFGHLQSLSPSSLEVFNALKISAHVLTYVSCAANPVVYGLMSENFRKALDKTIACTKDFFRRNVFVVVMIFRRQFSCGKDLAPNSDVSGNIVEDHARRIVTAKAAKASAPMAGSSESDSSSIARSVRRARKGMKVAKKKDMGEGKREESANVLAPGGAFVQLKIMIKVSQAGEEAQMVPVLCSSITDSSFEKQETHE